MSPLKEAFTAVDESRKCVNAAGEANPAETRSGPDSSGVFRWSEESTETRIRQIRQIRQIHQIHQIHTRLLFFSRELNVEQL
ncbi:uncharacterized protein V6R79_009786 [Siganus canaliculatus]